MKSISKKLVAVMTSVLLCLAMSVVALADQTGTANTAVVSAMTGVANDMTATATSLIPVALGVVGIVLVVVYGIKIFKRIASK